MEKKRYIRKKEEKGKVREKVKEERKEDQIQVVGIGVEERRNLLKRIKGKVKEKVKEGKREVNIDQFVYVMYIKRSL